MNLGILALTLAAWARVTIAQSRRWENPRSELFSTCLRCVPQALFDAPGIGFELADSYGTVAVHFNNGTTRSISRVDADDDYRRLMRRAVVGSFGSLDQPRSRLLMETNWMLQRPLQLMQSWIRTSSEPSDAEVVSGLLKQLRNAAQAHSGEKVYLALATQRNEPPFPDETLTEAFNLARISRLTNYKVWGRSRGVSNVASGLSASGLGSCENWKNIGLCEDEDVKLPWKQTLAITFTLHSLIISNACLAGPHRVYEYMKNIHWDLGLSRMNEPAYWDRVRRAIEDMPTSDGTTNWLLLTGEAAADSRFIVTLAQALRNMNLYHLYEEWESREQNPLFIASRGAARLAKVWQASTHGCKERRICLENRPKDDGEGVTLKEMFDTRATGFDSCHFGECSF